MPVTLKTLAGHLGGTLHGGDPNAEVEGVAPLSGAGRGQVAFVTRGRFREALGDTRAGVVILVADDLPACPVPALVCDDPHLGFARAARLLHPPPALPAGVHPTAHVDPNANLNPSAAVGPHCVVGADCDIGEGVVLGPGCILEPGSRVGAGSRLEARVTLGRGVIIGRRALIQPGAVIGADGFGFAREGRTWVRVPQVGGVRLGDDVEVGANTTIDRGALEDTVLEDGVKLDNLVQVAHNVRIGAHTAVAGCVGIAGSARIGQGCSIGGGAGILGHLEIVDGVTVTAMSLVTRSIREPGIYASGVPQAPAGEWNRSLAYLRRLGDLFRRVRRIERTLMERGGEQD
ncbi:MAG: UDP-3-O-(3-hydroxymyristoyl)glucosamine N-acyltransferase [Ectothiorhodospira sp.]